jgi:two-component system, chemotaxis family, sensor kinase CheA
MLKLSFNQKVGLGFAIIILLLLSSGFTSLWNLNDINNSTSSVNQTAVPVVKESNQVQIQLLKLAKLSTLAFNAEDKESIRVYKREFDAGIEEFDSNYKILEQLTEKDSDMQTLVIGIKSNYDFYRFAVDEMFEAKLTTINTHEEMLAEADELFALADGISGALVEMQYFMADPEYDEQMELIAGFANQADANALSIFKTIQEVQRATQIDSVSPMDDFRFALDDSQRWFRKGADLFKEFGSPEIIEAGEAAYANLSQRFNVEPSIVALKIKELEQVNVAKQKLGEADAAVTQSIAGLDELLAEADQQFTNLQDQVLGSLDIGFKMSIGMLIVLILLATANFNSMRTAIAKKMADLAKLNKIGGFLAAAQSQNAALEEVLQSMHEKMGVSDGSVYLTNQNQELVLKAHFPPKSIDSKNGPAKFALGEGVLGKAGKTKKIIFVPNTERDKSFVSSAEGNPKALLCVPLLDKDLLVGVINLSGDVKEVSFADSDYEYVSSVAQSLVTTIKNIRMREVIEEQNRNLEAKVEERTAELRQKNNDIANMMANMHQGLFTIIEGGSVHKEYAAYLEQIFETDRIAGRNVNDLLFANTTLGSDAKDQNITAVDAIVGEDSMMFDFNSHCLVKEMTIGMEDGRQKILELDWDPIVSEDDVVDKLMITVRDVTELRQLEAAAQDQKKELELIGEVLAVDAAKFSEFLRTSKQFMEACHQAIKDNPTKEQAVIAELFRNMHTVKGNARTYGLSYLTNVVHEVETTYDVLRNDADVAWDQAALLVELENAQEVLGKYNYIFCDKLGRDGEATSGVSLDPERVASLLDGIKRITQTELNTDVKDVVSEAYSMLITIDSKPLSDVIADVTESVYSMADQLGKPKPKVQIEDGNVYIDESVHTTLNNVFMHVMRNAVDHGIESEEERLSKGKAPEGTITVNTNVSNGFACFSVSDDGKGLALKKVRELAIEKDLISADQVLSAQETANLIFSSGFSTADEVSDLSGRGVGMDAVREFLESEGGSIELVLHEGAEDDAFRGFETRISIPERLYTEAISFSKTA